MVETGGDAFERTLGGTALSQGTSQGNFSLASIAGSSYVFGAPSGIFTGILTGLNSTSYTASNNFTLYFVDDAHAVMIETDSTQLALGLFELQE